MCEIFCLVSGTNTIEKAQYGLTKMLLPRHFVDESDLLLRRLVGTAVAVKDVGRLPRVEILDSLIVQLVKDLRRGGLVDVVPVHVFRRFTARIQHNETILGRTTRVLAGIDGEGVAVLGLGHDALLVGHFVVKQLLVGQIAVDRRRSRNAELVQAHFEAGVGALDRGAALVGIATGGIPGAGFGRGAFESDLLVLRKIGSCGTTAREEGLSMTRTATMTDCQENRSQIRRSNKMNIQREWKPVISQ